MNVKSYTNTIPEIIDFTLQSDVNKSFRCQCAANSQDIDVKKKNTHHMHIENIRIPEKWNIGLVVGSSGSGKTTLIKHLFGEDVFACDLDVDAPIIEQFPKEISYEDCAKMLIGIGLSSVPCWIRPYKTLSNGQQARAQAAYMMSRAGEDIVCIDEWTSVVDRTVAKAMSACVNRFARKCEKKIILCSCHYDIIEWVKPDWMIDCNKQEFLLPKSDNFFFQEREELKFDIREIDKSSWKYFSKYHYLSERIPGGKTYFFGLFSGEEQIGFNCYANYVPHKKGRKIIYHFNRTVIHPDYVGLGLGLKFINETARIMKSKIDCEIMGKFSSIPVYAAMKKDERWRLEKTEYRFGYEKRRKVQGRGSGFRECGIKTWSFKYIR